MTEPAITPHDFAVIRAIQNLTECWEHNDFVRAKRWFSEPVIQDKRFRETATQIYNNRTKTDK